MSNTIRMIGCGGAGISLTDEVGGLLGELGEGFAKVDKYFVDTAEASIAHVKTVNPKFHLIKKSTTGGTDVTGSGGDRKTNAQHIIPGVKDFLDNNKMSSKETGVFYVVVFAASSGSGSVIGPMVIKNLLEKNIPTVVVMIGDSTNGLSAINTLNTIATLHAIANGTKKPLSVMYVNNESFMNNGAASAIKEANRSVFNSLSALTLFLSGVNHELDNQDMINIIDQSNYSTINIKPGLYALNAFSKDVALPDGCIPTVARTLTVNGVSPDINVPLLHHKNGKIIEENAARIYAEYAPLHLVSYTNFFTQEESRLKKYTSTIYDSIKAIEINEISGTSESEVDENGLVF